MKNKPFMKKNDLWNPTGKKIASPEITGSKNINTFRIVKSLFPLNLKAFDIG